MKEKKRLRYEKWKDHLTNTRDKTNYSIRRMDLLIISICGAGLYIIFGILKEFKAINSSIENSNYLIWSGILFLIAITANFISQLTAFSANDKEEAYALRKLEEIEGNKVDECELNTLDDKIQRSNTATDILNYISVSTMLGGLIFLTIFNFLLF